MHGKAIRFGLAAVKGVGEGAVEAIQAARAAGGPFLSVTDFCTRVDGRKVNSKVLEALVKSGAFDGIAQKNGVSRAKLFTAVAAALARAAEAQRDRESGQTSLLSLLGGGSAANPAPQPMEDAYDPAAEEWLPRERLSYEKRAWAFTSAATPWISSRARCAATPTPTPPPAWSTDRAARSRWVAWCASSRSAWPRAAPANTPSSSSRISWARWSSWWATSASPTSARCSPAVSRCW
jgi:DNA polymerase III alpha subunit